MPITEAGRQEALERHVGLCVKIAALGFGPEVARLALERNGVPPAAARLIALSVASSRAALKTIKSGAPPPPLPARDPLQRRTSLAASRFLGRMLAFFWFGLVAIGGGLALGWMAGFERGALDGLDAVARALEAFFWR